MNKKSFHKSRDNKIITLFRALKAKAKAFLVPRNTTLVVAALISLLLFALAASPIMAAKAGKIKPVKESIVIFPSEVSSTGWQNISTLGSQDLRDNSLYQDFNQENSAYLTPLDTVINEAVIENDLSIDEQLLTPESIPVTDLDPDVVEQNDDSFVKYEEVVELPVIEGIPEPDLLPEIVLPEESPEVVPDVVAPPIEAEPVVSEESAYIFGLPDSFSGFKPAVGTFSLLQAVTTTPISIPAPLLEPPEEEPQIVVDEAEQVNLSDVTVEVPTDEFLPPAEIEPAVLIDEVVTESEVMLTPTSSALKEIMTQQLPSDVVLASDNALPKQLKSDTAPYSIILRDFGISGLSSGQFIENLQLRLSLAGQYEVDASSTPAFLNAHYSFGGFSRDAGSVLLEGEVSNAINGGYYVISLPSIKDPSLLSDLEITLSFDGDVSRLGSLYIDATWLEVATVSYDKKLLKDRYLSENLKQLSAPRIMDFLSDEVDFTRDETPRFSLRYNSQRNFLVQAFRKLFASEFAQVDDVKFLRNGVYPLEITSDVSVTADGIINISLTESGKAQLKPGTYVVEVDVDEGGVITTDSFEFQWGLLTINTNQTEYTAGDTVNVSMGALTPNGNTLCEANLNLYVISPNGFIDSVPVAQSGQCFGNNVIDVPDFSTQFTVADFGTYELYLERVDDMGNVISHTTDTFNVVPNQEIVIERYGPTRIFPPAPYTMNLSVRALRRSFDGELIERVPNTFEIFNTTAEIRKLTDYTELVWPVSMLSGNIETVSYSFDAPDISPFLFNLGTARLVSTENVTTVSMVEVPAVVDTLNSSSSSSSAPTFTEVSTTNKIETIVFEEHRQWQIASDALQPTTPNLADTPAFDNMLATTTRPVLGGFAAYDPDGDVVEYEIQVDDNFDFSSPVFTKDSVNYPSDAGWSAATFTSGATTTYAIQVADALTDGTLYWWRVRAKDPTDTNTWTAYTTPRSFKIDTAKVATQWHQTLGLQFERGTRTGVSTTTNSVTLPSVTTVPTLINSWTANSVNPGSSLTLTKPASVQVDDLLIIIVGDENTTATAQWDNTTNKPSGFTLINESGNATSDAHVAAFYKVADGTEGSTIAVPKQASDGYWGFYIRVTGADTSNPINVVGADSNTGNSVSKVIPSITTTVNNTLAFYALASDGGDNDPFSISGTGWVEGAERESGPTANDASGVWGTRAVPTAGATGNATVGMSASDGAAAFQFAINPAPITSGAIMSPEVDFDWVPNQKTWGDISWSVTQPASTIADLQVYYSAVTACDTLIPDVDLPGNSTGFASTSSSLPIFTLSTSTYNRICLKMTLDKAGGATDPSLDDWTIRFDLPNQSPLAPTLETLPAFDYLFATTTPTLGAFSATDYELDDMEYQVVIDNDADFSSPVLTKQSSDYPTDAGWSTSTFTAGATTTYTVQPADALADGVTYWWKVRARDPAGTNTWSDYSESRTVTIDSGLLEKAWHQTLGAQFESGTFSNSTTTTNGVEMISTGQTVVPVVESGWTTATAVPGNSIVLNKPTGVQPDDLLLVFVGNDAANAGAQWSGTTLATEGFILIDEQGDNTTDSHVAAFYKVADGTEASTLTVNAASSQDYWGFYIRVSGVDPNDPFDQVGTAYLGGNVTDKAVPSITTTVDNELAFYVLAADDGNQAPFSVTSPWTEVDEIQAGTLAGNASGVWGTQNMTTLGATGNANITSSVANGAAGFQFALNPAPTTAGTIMSSEIDFDWVEGQTDWGLVQWNVTEPAGSDSLFRLYYTNVSACDTLVSDVDLPGNSAGFDVTQTNMFIDSLSTSTYNRICLSMELSVQSTTTSPTLDDWTVRWVIPNQAPYTSLLAETPAFDNYKSTTTRPVFGGFASSDYELDSLEYQIIIDDNSDFSSPVLTKQSSDYPTDAGWSAATFTSGATTTYTIQPADALTSGVTYWWKVRARDPAGSNEWGYYSMARSMTVSNVVTIPEWYQTTDKQFETNMTLTNATTTGSGGITIDSDSVSVALLDTWSTGNTKTVSAGSDRLLVVSIISEDNALNSNVDTVTYGGQTLTEIVDQQVGTGFSNGMWVGYLDEAGIQSAVGTTIVPTWVGTAPSNGLLYTSAVYEDVNQDYPVRGFSANALTSGITITPTASIAVSAGDSMFYIAESASGLTHTPATGYTEGTEEDTGGSGFVAASAYKDITSSGSEYPEATWSASGNRLLMVAVALQPSSATAQIMSNEIDFDWVSNQNDWGEVIWHVTEPNGSDSRLSVYYTNVTPCDTIVPDGALTGNSVGFQSGGSPVDISSLSTSTYNRICLQMTLDSGTALSFPYMTDWGVSWQLSSVFEQSSFWWYNNTNAITPTDAWPPGATNLTENQVINSTNPTKYSDVLRLRMGLGVTAVTANDNSFKLQYAAGLGCSESLNWMDVGPIGSSTALWRGYNNAGVSDGATLPSAILSATDVLETYEEENNSATIVNPIASGQYGEFDWVLENRALPGTYYCFRMVNLDGSRFKTYTNYPQLVTNQAPTIASVDTPFDNEKVPTTLPVFEFTAIDAEGNDVDYQVQIDNDVDFSSPVVDYNSITNFNSFENLVTIADKSPFNESEVVRFTLPATLTNGVTYWWRVRAKDTDYSAQYGDWITPRSFTVDTSVTLTTWFQTTEEQFDTNTLEGTDATASDLVTFASGSTTGTTTSSAIDFDYVTSGNAWGSFSFNETGAANDILYHIEYYTGSGWVLVPDGALAGNAAGYDTSPVDLIDLDTEIYNQIRIRANFLAGSPTLTDWTVTWGERVSVPTHLLLFDNEKTDITTPTFTFLSTDPQGDDLEYEFSYSTDNTFLTGSTTVNSSTSPGFVNIVNGGDTTPFNSGETISYTVQSALTDGVTYWWRLRARDPNGGNGYSFWSDPWSFTIDANATTSTWFQTTQEQFDTDTMVGLVASTSDSVSTIPASVVDYDFTGITSPSASHVARDFQVTVNDPTDPPTNNSIDTLTVLGTSVSTPNLRTGIANHASDAEATSGQYTSIATSDNNRWTITDPGNGNNAVFWVKFHVDENPSNISQLDLLLEGYQGGTPAGTDKAWFGIWRPGTTTPFWELLEASQQTADYNYTGTITSNLAEYFDGNNDVHLVFFNEDDSDSLLVDYVSMTVTSDTATEGTITGTSLDFDDGSGPAWGQMYWSDVEPGASTINYQLEYLNGVGTWVLIPDIDLANNSTGYTTAPIDLKYLDTTTYNQIRPVANFTCSGPNCSTLNDWTIEWSRGFSVSGTAYEYDGVTPMTSGIVNVAVNGVLQSGKTATISAGAWTIDNVTYFDGDVVTVFVSGAASADEAVAVTKYDGTPDITGMRLQKRHLTIGSDDNALVTNTDIGQYDFTANEDLFFDVNGSNVLNMCADTGCFDAGLVVLDNNTYSMNANTVTHDVRVEGTLIGEANTLRASGSWTNTGTTTLTNTTVIMTATSTAETIDVTGAVVGAFNNLTLGETSGTATWTLNSPLDVNGTLKVDWGTLARGTEEIYLSGTLTTGVNGFWTGIGTTTIDGVNPTSWTDNNTTKQNLGYVVVDGSTKTLVLQTNTAMQSLTIGADDAFDLNNKTTTIYQGLQNNNTFTPRSGTVVFAATTGSNSITMGGSSFYNLTFNGVGGAWAFVGANLAVSNDFTIATGTVTMPTGTTTIAGSFNATGGAFAHNNGTMLFTTSAAKTITFDGGLFTNVANNLVFTGSGSWIITDTNATSTNDIRVTQGTLNFPSGVMAIGGRLADTGGAYVGGAGTVLFYSSGAEVLTAGGSSFNNVIFDGTGSWSFSDTTADANGDLIVQQGSLTMPSSVFTVGGSYSNNAVVNAGSGTLTFDATTAGKTVNFGNSTLYNVNFNGVGGEWTLTAPATTTNDLSLTNVGIWDAGGQLVSVGNVFTNGVGGASTTWTGATLSLETGNYSLNTKTAGADSYNVLRVQANTDIKMWNSVASTYVVNSTGSLYSQDHNAVDGDLYIFGAYERNGGNEYWDYATDFDGVALGGSGRQVDVRFASGASALFNNSIVSIQGSSTASTTIANQGSGTYVVNVSGGTTTAQYYEFVDLGATGVSFTDGAIVSKLRDGAYTVSAVGGTALTISSTTIDANPAKQIYNVTFATTTAIAAYNVSQTDGTPVSYWWFRNGFGNLYGEGKDNDTGDPGSVRFDDSSLTITVAGTVYSDAGITPITGGTCDGLTAVVRVVVNGGTSYTGSCSNVDGSYSIAGVAVVGDPTLTVYLDNASGGEKGSVITRTPTADITNLDIYANRVIVRNEDVDALTISNLAIYDNSDDGDLQFLATTSPVTSLTVQAGNELFISASSTFTPEGIVTLSANAQANSYDGTMYLAGDATFNAYDVSTVTIGGRLELSTGAQFNAGSTTVLMNATTTGKSVTADSEITFNDLMFNGVGGGWNLGADILIEGDITITNGTVTGTDDIYVQNGSLTGNGILSLGAGTTTLAASNTLGGNSAWTFYNLALGDTFQVGTTTPVFTSTTTVSGRLTINAAHYLQAGNTRWDLAGAGTVFVESGTFLEDTSTIRYSGAGANVLSTQYYNLDINAGVGAPTYTATGLGLMVDNLLSIGGDSNSTFDLNTNDPLLDVNGDVLIRSNGSLSGSNSAILTIAGNYNNTGTFTGNGGTVTFDGTGVTDIAAGNSSFSNVRITATGDVTISENATSTGTFMLAEANSFTLASGKTLAVGTTFFNAVGGATTIWTGSTLSLYGSGNYQINAATTSDSYANLKVSDTAQIRMWNSDASVYDVAGIASLYSQDHSGVDGDLYIWGAYRRTSGSDSWSYDTDFDGTSLSGSERKVNVYLASGASVIVTGGSLAVFGIPTASTTIQNQGAGTYGLLVGGNASSSFKYYEVRNTNSAGLTFTGSAKVNKLSYGDFAVSQNGGTAMTVSGTVISANPARNFTGNRFWLDGVAGGFNVTATGTSISSWRFANHYGDIDGEAFDVDPDGDPGYIAWDDSAALITISGSVYNDEGVTASGVCDGVTNNVTLRVAGITSYNTSCNAGTGAYNISNVSYGSTDSLVVYIDGEAVYGATVTKEPISNINGLNIYENRVILRHENTDPINIADMAVWDSSDDADIPFTAVDAGTDTLTLPANRKLLVWSNTEFAPNGDVTVSGGGAGAAYDGTVELLANAIWTGQGTEALSIGGSYVLGTDATFVASNGTTTFTTSGAARTIDVNENSFNNVQFTGSGSWTVADPTLTTSGNITISNGALTLPTGTTTIAGSLVNTGGSFDANTGLVLLSGSGAQKVTLGGSDLAAVEVASGVYTITDTNATTTASATISGGSLALPSGTFVIGGDFRNTGGSIVHNTSELNFVNVAAASLLASSSDLFGVRFTGGGAYTMEDVSLALLDSLIIENGDVTLATGTLAIGGSFDGAGGTFNHASGTILFNSTDGGEYIDAGISPFYSVQINAPTGGYTVLTNATTTKNFSLVSANSFTVQPGVTLVVEGVFMNSVGGSNTTWTGSTLVLDGANEYTVNTKVAGGDQYDTVQIGTNSDIRFWNSAATTTLVDVTSSIYSQDHAGNNGLLNIYGDFHIATTTEYWSYATDFDGTSLSGSERDVTVQIASGATTTVDGGTLQIIGASAHETMITNQSAGTYALAVSDGLFNAQYYKLRNLNAAGLEFTEAPTISSLSYGDYELAVNGGTLISLASTTLNANASMVITGNRFATTTAITGANVTLNGSTTNVWTFTSHTGNLDGEAFDVDGLTDCGSIRWNDSACLLTQQTNYRWRNDDGGLEVPDSEWYNASWTARKAVRLENNDATTYTDAAVQLQVVYDVDMQSDFSDLRFTASDGVTEIPYWIGAKTNSSEAEVWVKVPSLAAESTTNVFMYYKNALASSVSSSTEVFIAADDFEDNNISEYGGQTTLFSADAAFGYDGVYGVGNAGHTLGRANTGGIYRLDQTVSQGETFRYLQYIDTSATSDETCTKFAIQNTSIPNNNYAVCVELPGTDHISLVRDVVDNEASAASLLASSSVSLSTGWYEMEVGWGTDDSFAVTMKDSGGSVVASMSASDSNYTSGGYGFTYWFNAGGWDSLSSRPLLTTEPTVLFGAEQTNGGATWKVAQNTAANYTIGDVARLRLSIENSGLPITNQQFLLEYAAMGVAPSCEAVNPANFAPVPVQASCGTSPVCMQSSTYFTNGVSTVDLLTNVSGLFAFGEAIEDPANITSNLDIAQDEYTEVEYAITPTINTVDENICFRVTDNGTDLDTYLKVAQLSLRFDPVMSTATLNDGQLISLLPGTTTRVYATGTVTDLNGYSDIVLASSTIYRSGVTGGAACTADNNDCYISTTANNKCSFTNCVDNSCTVSCYADIYFHADPTDAGSIFEGQDWQAFIEVEDASAGYDFASALGVELGTLRAIDTFGTIDYGALAVNDDTGSYNASTSILNEGNVEINLEIQGTDLIDGYGSAIPADKQKFATSTFTYSGCGASCELLSSTTPVVIDVDLVKPTSETPPIEDDVFWGIAIPIGVNSAPHQGINVFTPISP